MEHQPPPVAVPRSGPRTWVVVLVTLGAVALAAAIFVAGVFTGAVLSRIGAADDSLVAGPAPLPPAPAPSGPGAVPGPGSPPSDAPAAPGPSDGSFDDCLVGTWRTVSHEEQYETEQGPASLTGLTRLVEFTADGGQTIRYDGSEATVTTQVGALPAVFDGEVRYQVRTDAGTMSFELLSSEGTVTIVGPDGTERVEDLRAGAGAVTYTCEGDTFTQRADGFSADYERTS